MLIGVGDPKPPFDKPPVDCWVTITVGGLAYNVGPAVRSELREDLLAFAERLKERRRFTPELAFELHFYVDFRDEQFVAYHYRPRFKREGLWWLGSVRVVSNPESISDGIAYLSDFVASLE